MKSLPENFPSPKPPEGVKRRWKKTTLFKKAFTHYCFQCCEPFEAYPSSNRKFCSLKCAYANEHRVYKQPKDRGVGKCENCKTEFKLRTNGGVRFCSRPCANSFIGKISLRANRRRMPRTTYIMLTCQHCEKQFGRWKSNVTDGKWVFCSPKCAADYPPAKVGRSKARRANGALLSENSYSRVKRGWRTIGGKRIHFRSSMEANYARFLTFMGIEWEFESKTFWFEKIKRGVLSYTPDFYLPATDSFVECKGWMDAKSKTKLKRMRKYHSNIKLVLLDWKAYLELQKRLGKVIPEWEN